MYTAEPRRATGIMAGSIDEYHSACLFLGARSLYARVLDRATIRVCAVIMARAWCLAWTTRGGRQWRATPSI